MWGPWGEYSDCSTTCSNGIQTRFRECIGGNPGDRGCDEGLPSENDSCNRGVSFEAVVNTILFGETSTIMNFDLL